MAKKKLILSLDPEIADRLRQFAFENHTTMSQAVTDWILKQKVSFDVPRGQMSFDETKEK